MLRKRSVGKEASTFPAQALPCSGSTGLISASDRFVDRSVAPRELDAGKFASGTAKIYGKVLRKPVTFFFPYPSHFQNRSETLGYSLIIRELFFEYSCLVVSIKKV